MKKLSLVLILLLATAGGACGDLEPALPTPKDAGAETPDAAIPPDAATVAGADASLAGQDASVADAGLAPDASSPPDAGSSWTKDCLDLPGHELYETGCDETMVCTNGQLSSAWFGPSGSGSSTMDFSTMVEGALSWKISCSGAQYCGVTDECPQNAPTAPKSVNLSGWTTLHISLKGNAPDVEIKMASLPVDSDDFRDEVFVRASSYGYAPDGAWHSLSIPVSAMAQDSAKSPHHAFDPTKVYKPLIVGLLDMAGSGPYTLNVDAVYLTK